MERSTPLSYGAIVTNGMFEAGVEEPPVLDDAFDLEDENTWEDVPHQLLSYEARQSAYHHPFD